ncbi:glutamate-1-semialdehyde 2,1-aminomutase [Humibacter antri]
MTRTLTRTRELYERAQRSIAGGVSSDARRMEPVPLFVDRARGAELWDVDGNRYLDYVLGQGPNILGHAPEVVREAVTAQLSRGLGYSAQHEAESEVAERLCRMIPSAERVRFNSVGSEAAHAALRLARAHTGRRKIVKFEGHYHGWFDTVLFSVHPDLTVAGDRQHPATVPGSPGLTPHVEDDLVVLPFNDAATATAYMAEHGSEVAAIILEPILCNTGAIFPLPGYLELLRDLTRSHGSLLIFDEIITGFRVAAGGAQELLGVTPDLSVFGKAMAGGMQLSALVGRGEIMDDISAGHVAHAGTFNSHPVSIAAANATLRMLDEQRDDIYPALTRRGHALMDGIVSAGTDAGVPVSVSGPGPVFQTYVGADGVINDYRDYAATDRAFVGRLHRALLERGVSIVPRGLWFLSTSHNDDHITQTVEAFAAALDDVRK